MERVIVSKEIESLVDKEKILGNSESDKLEVALESPDFFVSSYLEMISVESNLVEIHFIVSSTDVLKILFSTSEKEIIISSVKSFNCRKFKSISFERVDDMYLCKIIINNLE